MGRMRYFLFGIVLLWVMGQYVPDTYGQGISIKTDHIFFPAVIDGKTYKLEARIYQPNDHVSHPLIVMNHGRNGPNPSRNPNEYTGYMTLNQALASKGYVVMMLVRRGYGTSDGPDSEFKDTAVSSGLEAAKDIQSAVAYMRQKDYVNKDKVVIMGHSQGGWAALASSTVKMDGVIGAVNLCGGTNYSTMGSGNVNVAVQEHWIWACGELGKTAKVPALWIYSENDRNHQPFYVNQMFLAFQNAGGQGKLIIKPPYGDNGHMIIQEPNLFMNDVMDFFTSIGFLN